MGESPHGIGPHLVTSIPRCETLDAVDAPAEHTDPATPVDRLRSFLHGSLGRLGSTEADSVSGRYAEKHDDLDPGLLEIAADLTRRRTGG